MSKELIRTKTELKQYLGVSIQTLRRWVLPLVKTEIIRYRGALSPMEVKIIFWHLSGDKLPDTLVRHENEYIQKISNYLNSK